MDIASATQVGLNLRAVKGRQWANQLGKPAGQMEQFVLHQLVLQHVLHPDLV